ncbi:MAG TPA: ABC transporter ATP-binding protein, partial [Bacillota bacterium]
MPVKLAAEALTVGYGEAPVLRDLDLRIDAGEWVAVIGPNGCGKTTLLRVLTGLLRPAAGRVRLDGLDLAALPRTTVARRLALAGAWPAADFPFTVAEYVLLGRIPHRSTWGGETAADWQAVERALALTHCTGLADRLLPTLSEGERQRAALARALAQEPEVLLLDEPTAHLDLGHQVETMELLTELHRQAGLTLITVLHDLNLAALYCPRLV